MESLLEQNTLVQWASIKEPSNTIEPASQIEVYKHLTPQELEVTWTGQAITRKAFELARLAVYGQIRGKNIVKHKEAVAKAEQLV